MLKKIIAYEFAFVKSISQKNAQYVIKVEKTIIFYQSKAF